MDPLRILGSFASTILSVTGRAVGLVVGVVLLILGTALTLTGIGAILGIPLLLVGFAVVLRALR